MMKCINGTLTQDIYCNNVTVAISIQYVATYIYIYIRGAFNMVPDIFVLAFKIVVDSENSVCYCYTSYEMTDQFL